MQYIMEIPVKGGGVLRVQGPQDEVPAGLVPAVREPGTEPGAQPGAGPGSGPLIAKADETIQDALDGLKPAIEATAGRLRELAADEVTVEFGLLLGVTGGVVIAKGSAEVHFTVTLTWNKDGTTGR